MTSARPAWPVVLPLLVGGWLAGHAVAYRAVARGPHEHAGLLAETGHGYLAHAPALAAALAAVGVVALVLRLAAAAAARGRPAPVAIGRGLALLPPAGFAVQEHVERLVSTGALQPATILEPVFLVGLAVQVPFAVAALVLGRVAVRAADGLGALLVARRVPRPRPRPPAPAPARPAWTPLRRLPLLASGSAGRAPPACA